MIYWFIGQPGSGKSTLSKRLKEDTLRSSIYLDGDDLRKIFGNSYSKEHFTKEYRVQQTEALQRFIAYLADQGFNIIVSTVNPYRDVRETFKKSRTDIFEIYVHTDVPRIREENWVQDFEPPLENFADLNTTNKTEQQSMNELWKLL